MTKYERAALRDVNRIRRAEGRKPLKRLPKGAPYVETHCPIANALDGGKVNVGEVLTIPASKLVAYLAAGLKLTDGVVDLLMPKSFHQFVSWFDSQKSEEAQALNINRPEEEEEEGV